MAIDPRLYSGKRELCKDCGAVDGNGNQIGRAHV